MMKKLLEAKRLTKYFPILSGLFRHEIGQIKAVDGIDFTIFEGKVLGMVGESGSGKSTAARAAIRLIEPTSGQVHFQGKNLQTYTQNELKKIRQKIQIVFQDPSASLNPRKTIGQSIGEALTYHRLVANPKEQEEITADLLRKVGLSPEAMSRYPHQFSGGQQQRICIGRAIAMNPKLIVCDEAVSSLDVSIQAQILNLLMELKETMGFSYLFISHDLSVIRHISDDVVVMRQGKIMEHGSVEGIFHHPKHPYTQQLLAAIPKDYPSVPANR